MMLPLYDVGYIDEHVILIYEMMILCYKLYETKFYLWSPILCTWLCEVMGLHMTIAIVGWGWDYW